MGGSLADMLKKTYEMSTHAPPALDWYSYRELVLSEWERLLNEQDVREESDFQQFLEMHPCLVPGFGGMIGTSGHAPYLAALFSQPRLPDFTCKIPDFMWIAKDSQSIYPIMIEIEAPKKKWFNKDGTTTADFNQSRDQLIEWKEWFSRPRNQLAFADHYKQDTTFRQLRPHYVLIYGRRGEANQSENLAAKRQHLQDRDVSTMTYDRLMPLSSADQSITVRAKRDGYEALYVPATFQLGPMNAEAVSRVGGMDDAIARSPFITPDRKQFLIDRLIYWRSWVQDKNISVRVPSDRE